MFQSPKSQGATAKNKTPPNNAAVTILTSGCHFSGKLYCRGSSRIGGKIEGQIISEGLLIIEDEAVITAEIKADEVVIQGRVQGKLQASSRVELCAQSQFEGDIATPVLIVKEGAQFNGRSSMVKAEEASKGQGRLMGAGKGGPAPSPSKDAPMPDIAAELLKSADAGRMKSPEVKIRGA